MLPYQLGKVYGIESHVLSPAETKDLYPLMNVDDLYGTLYVPKDGTMDPAGTCTTLTRAASARGATVIENCPVTGIQVGADHMGVKKVRAVETPHGTIETPCVVNCAGEALTFRRGTGMLKRNFSETGFSGFTKSLQPQGRQLDTHWFPTSEFSPHSEVGSYRVLKQCYCIGFKTFSHENLYFLLHILETAAGYFRA